MGPRQIASVVSFGFSWLSMMAAVNSYLTPRRAADDLGPDLMAASAVACAFFALAAAAFAPGKLRNWAFGTALVVFLGSAAPPAWAYWEDRKSWVVELYNGSPVEITVASVRPLPGAPIESVVVGPQRVEGVASQKSHPVPGEVRVRWREGTGPERETAIALPAKPKRAILWILRLEWSGKVWTTHWSNLSPTVDDITRS